MGRERCQGPIERRTMDAQKSGNLGHGFAGLLDKLASMGDLLRPGAALNHPLIFSLVISMH